MAGLPGTSASTQKLGRHFKLTYYPQLPQGQQGPNPSPIVITDPLTCHFWLERNTYADLNRLSIDLYNLSDAHRKTMFQDHFDLTNNNQILFEAGYGQMHQVFKGRVYTCSSAREGVNMVTRIEARDGQYDVSNTQTQLTVQSGQKLSQIFKTLIAQFPNLKTGAVGNFPTVLNGPVVMNGNTWALIQQYSGNKAYIDNNKVYVMNINEVLATPQVPLINASTGLLETPRRQNGYLDVTTLLETSFGVNTLVNLQSVSQPAYNGQYAIIGMRHQGVISGAVSGEARSTFSLLHPTFFKQFTQVPGQ